MGSRQLKKILPALLKNEAFENSLEETIEYTGSADMDMFNLLVLKPSYTKNEKYRSNHSSE